MIVEGMSYLEAYNQIESDLPKVEKWAEKYIPKVTKAFGKGRKFPQYHIEKYTHVITKNEYRIFYYLGNAKEKVNYVIFFVTFYNNERLVIRTDIYRYKHTPKSREVLLPIINIYLTHFIKRYNERCLHLENVSDDVIAGYFFARNELSWQIPLNENIKRNFQKYGCSNEFGMRVKDGFCFVSTMIEGKQSDDSIKENNRVDAMRLVYTTFMKESDMSDTQRAAIEKEHIETLKECMNEFRDMLIDDPILKSVGQRM